MNVAVCVKHAVDEGELRADPSGRPQLQGALSKMSTFDRNAVEEAVRVKESKGGSVTVFSLGSQDWKKSMKEALAMGCDKGVAIASAAELDTLATSYYLARALQKAGPFDLILFSEGASDTYHGLVGPMVAEWLSLPFIGYARKVEVGEGAIKAEEAVDERVEVVEAALPAVVSVVSEVNSPRYPTLLQIMQASKKPMEELSLDSLRDERAPQSAVKVVAVTVQAVDRKKVLYEGPPQESAQKLLDALRKEGVV
jgi:electron transfer flavoprotein beta subunit